MTKYGKKAQASVKRAMHKIDLFSKFALIGEINGFSADFWGEGGDTYANSVGDVLSSKMCQKARFKRSKFQNENRNILFHLPIPYMISIRYGKT